MDFAKMFASFFWVGKSKIAPGTLASAVVSLPFLVLSVDRPVVLIFLIVSIFFGLRYSGQYARAIAKEDPGEIVIDEVSGMLMAFFVCGDITATLTKILQQYTSYHATQNTSTVGFTAPKAFYVLLVFSLFRCFDIVKPFPISFLDEKLHGSIGIMCDDIVAGLFTAGTILVLVKVLA